MTFLLWRSSTFKNGDLPLSIILENACSASAYHALQGMRVVNVAQISTGSLDYIYIFKKHLKRYGTAITKKEYGINKPPPSFHFRHNSVFKRLLVCLKEKICCPRLRISLPYFCWWSHPIKKSGRPRPGSLKIDSFIKTPFWEYGNFIFSLLSWRDF